MSGFVAVVAPTAQAPTTIGDMVDALSHRGPTVQTHAEDLILIGHRHRPTTPEAHREHHASCAVDGLIAAADARLDNRPELLHRLGTPGDATDLDLILEAYRRWDVDCARHLVGAFAFVVWDPRRAHLFGARDHFGVRPLYSGQALDGSWCIGSEPRALLRHPQMAQGLNRAYVESSLRIGAAGAGPDDCAFAAINRVPPAHSFVVGPEKMEFREYWRLGDAPELDVGRAEAVYRFREIFVEAVGCRTRTGGRLATHLSGGLDSSSVTATAASLATDRPTAITNSFDSVPECDERVFAKQVVDHAEIAHHVFPADSRGPLDVLDDVIPHLNEPYIGSNHHLVWGLGAAAADIGTTTVLDGFDGDSIVSHGYARLSELVALRRWSDLRTEASAVANAKGNDPARVILQYSLPTVGSLIRRGRLVAGGIAAVRLGGSVPGAARYGARALRHAIRSKEMPPPFVGAHADHMASLDPRSIARTLEWLDLFAAHHGLDARHPFMDKRLVEFCVGLPAQYKLWEGHDRWVARMAMEGLLPPAIQWRARKTDMNPNFLRGLLVLDRNRLISILDNELEELRGAMNIDAFRTQVQTVLAAPPQNTSARDALQLWRVVATAKVLARRWPGELGQ